MVKGSGIEKNFIHHRRCVFLPGGERRALSPAPIDKPLLYFAFGSPVVCCTASGGVSLAVGLSAPKWTSKILATSIARMGEKKYPAMLAPAQTFS